MNSEDMCKQDGKGLLIGIARNNFGRDHKTGLVVLLCLALAAVILAVYLQVGDHQFLNFDDNDYVTKNPNVANGITANNFIWAFTSVHSYNWHPITWLSHMTDVQLFGMNPHGHHLTSLAVHTVSSLLLFLLLCRLTNAIWQSLFVASLFALHPLHVESVAWVAERKDVLSALFWFLTIYLYSEFVANRKKAQYFLTLLFFVLGLMAKPMLVTLPVVMLMIDFWPLNRYRQEETQGLRLLIGRITVLIKEKIPFFFFALLSGAITIYAQQSGGAIVNLTSLSFQHRCENALVAYVKYIGKTLWPHDLAVYYPISSSFPLWQVISSAAILFLLSATAIMSRQRFPYFAVGWFWFIITLIPVIGLVQVGGQSMADRYTYIPGIGLFIIVAWGLSDLTKDLRHRQSIIALFASTVIIASAVLTWQQLGYWRDNISLYRHTLQVTSGNYFIHESLGSALAVKGELDEAIQEYQESLRINPIFPLAHNSLGIALVKRGYLEEATREFRMALQVSPDFTEAYNNLGVVFVRKGDLDSAIHEFQKALQVDPDFMEALHNLKAALAQKKIKDEAIQ